jgi:hypothetical protein
VDVEAIKAESLVFDTSGPAMREVDPLNEGPVEPFSFFGATKGQVDPANEGPIIYEGELDQIKASAKPKPPAEYYQCLSRRCEALYFENEVGGEARGIVGQIANVVGVNLSPPLDGNVWSPANMQRVVESVKVLVEQVENLQGQVAEHGEKNNVTVKALHEALTHLGEGVQL